MRGLAKVGLGFLLGGALAEVAMATGLAIVGPCTSSFGAFCLFTAIIGFTVGPVCLLISGVSFAWRRIRNRNLEGHPPKLF